MAYTQFSSSSFAGRQLAGFMFGLSSSGIVVSASAWLFALCRRLPAADAGGGGLHADAAASFRSSVTNSAPNARVSQR
jgi:hypothetical protein